MSELFPNKADWRRAYRATRLLRKEEPEIFSDWGRAFRDALYSPDSEMRLAAWQLLNAASPSSSLSPSPVERRELIKNKRWGFLYPGEIRYFSRFEESRLWLVLIRTAQGRCLAPMQDVLRTASGLRMLRNNYIRDYSFPVPLAS